MDRFEMVENLVAKTGVSYEDAKLALEASDWDMLDAAVALEKDGKVEKKSAACSTESTAASDIRGRCAKKSGKIKRFLVDNKLIIRDKTGKEIIALPVWILIILLVSCIWVVVILAVVGFACGCRLEFTGPELGNEKINRAMDKAGDATENFVDGLKDKIDGDNND